MDYFLIMMIGLFFGNLINIYAIYMFQQKLSWCSSMFFHYKHWENIVVLVTTLGSLFLFYHIFSFSSQFVSYGILIVLLIAAAVVDIRLKIISNWLIIVAIAVGIVMVPVNTEITWYNALITAIGVGGMMWLTSIISKGALGMGDVKLLACIGLFLGLQQTLLALMFTTLVSGIVGLILIIISFANRKKQIPFAPFIFIGTMLAIVLSGISI